MFVSLSGESDSIIYIENKQNHTARRKGVVTDNVDQLLSGTYQLYNEVIVIRQ